MGNVLESEGGAVDYRPSTTSTNLKDELIISLTSFIPLYNQHEDHLQRASESFTQAVAQVLELQTESSAPQVLFSVSGGVLGGVCGGITGGVGGALGTVAAATCARLCGTINAAGASVGFFGSVVGGVAGGAFSGCAGGAVGVAAVASSSSFYGAANTVIWFTVGLATGGAIGGIFGGTVGAAGGAIGGGFGAFCGVGLAVYLVGGITYGVCGTKDSKENEKRTKKVNLMQEPADDFSDSIKPLVQKLKRIQMISDQITSSAHVRRFAGQTAKTLAAVTTMQKTISASQRATDPTQFAEAARQSRQITEELKKTSTEAGKLLVSLRNF